MPWLKAYEWEHKTWPWHQRVNIRHDLRASVTQRIAEALGICGPFVRLSTSGNGRAARNGRLISLPRIGVPCSLGLITHEVAHCLDTLKLGGNNGHRGTFRKALIKAYCEISRPLLCRILRDAVKDSLAYKVMAAELIAKADARAAAKARARAARKTPAVRIDTIKLRIKRLETKIKRETTLLAKARRSLAAMERARARRFVAAGFATAPAPVAAGMEQAHG